MEERLHVVFIGVERTERGEILCARVTFRNKTCSCSPGEFWLTVLYSEHLGHHARVAAVSVGKRMDFRNKLVMKSDEAFVQECLVFQPILNVAEELWNALQNVAGITANVQFMLAISSRPLPDLVEHFGVQRADVRFVQRVC